MSLLYAQAARDQGVALFDTRTPAHFGVGLTAGLAGIKPAYALIGLLGIEISKNALAHGGARQALFERNLESPANQIADLLVELTGYYLGLYVRAARAAAAQAPAAPAGLGCAGPCSCQRTG
jgi:hypothetical protein